MSDIKNILYFSECGTYPKRLASKIGIAKASLLWHLLQATKDRNYTFRQPFFSMARDYDFNVINSLIEDGYIIKLSDEYKINTEKLLSTVSDNETVIRKVKPTFENDEFISLCEKWEFKLRQKNRHKSLREIYSLFEGKTLEESLRALRLSVNNNYVTLMFDEHKEHNQNSRDRGPAWNSGGSKNSEERRNYSDFTTKD